MAPRIRLSIQIQQHTLIKNRSIAYRTPTLDYPGQEYAIAHSSNTSGLTTLRLGKNAACIKTRKIVEKTTITALHEHTGYKQDDEILDSR